MKLPHVCDDGCLFRHHMADVANPDFKIAYCSKYDEGIWKGTHCEDYTTEIEE